MSKATKLNALQCSSWFDVRSPNELAFDQYISYKSTRSKKMEQNQAINLLHGDFRPGLRGKSGFF